MSDLRSLFGTTIEDDSAPAPRPSSAHSVASLRALVGGPRVEASSERPGPTLDLRRVVGPSEALVPERVPYSIGAVVGEPTLLARPSVISDLSAVVGPPEPTTTGTSGESLEALVGAGRIEVAEAGWTAPELTQAGRRPLFGGRRRAGAVNYFSVAVAVLAVLALVGTVSFAVVQRATANPADDAMVSLREREAELANETKALQTSADLYAASASEAAGLASASAPVLGGLQGRVDAAPLAAAEASRASLEQVSVAALAAPASVPAYERDQIDEKSLADVGKALDAVHLAREALPALIADVREDRSRVVDALEAFRAALASVGAAIEAEAAKIAEANDSAAASYRSAVTDAAARVKAVQQAGGDGLGEMTSYAVAVDALRAENKRVVAIEEAERESAPTQPSTRNPSSGESRSGSTPTSPGGSNNTPSPAPTETTPPPTDPTDPPVDPTDPPVDPTDPPVDPIDPPVDGTTSGEAP